MGRARGSIISRREKRQLTTHAHKIKLVQLLSQSSTNVHYLSLREHIKSVNEGEYVRYRGRSVIYGASVNINRTGALCFLGIDIFCWLLFMSG